LVALLERGTEETGEEPHSPVDYPAAAHFILQQLIQRKLFGGAVVGILDNGRQEIFSVGDALPLDGLFELGSVSKVFTGLVLSKLITEQRISLEDSVLRYLPGTMETPPERPVRIIDLATHASDLPLQPDDVGRMQRSIDDPWAGYTVEDLHGFLARRSLERPAAPKFSYSNVDYFLLGDLMHNATGIPFPQLLDQEVLNPVGLRSTFLTVPADRQVVTAHTGMGRPATHWASPVFKLCGGGVCSTAADCLRLLQLCLAPPPEWRPVIDTMVEPRIVTGKRAIWSTAALPWFIDAENGWRWHNGVTGGHSAYIAFHPERRQALVVLADRYAIELVTDFSRRMQHVMEGHPAEQMTALYDLKRLIAIQAVLEFAHMPPWLRAGIFAAAAAGGFAGAVHIAVTLHPPLATQALRTTMLVLGILLLVIGGIALLHRSKMLRPQSGRFALLDAVASVYAVSVVELLLISLGNPLHLLPNLLLALACGITASAALRVRKAL